MKNELTAEEEQRILAFRHTMHEYPEVSNKEVRTTAAIREFLGSIPGVEILPLPVKTGVLAVLHGKGDGAQVGLRADIDALPQTEETDVPFISKVPGVMHACGHDTHTSALLGAALILSRKRETLPGDVVLLFQKAEETTTGAKEMIDAGLFDLVHPSCFFAFHNWPTVPCGKIVAKAGGRMAGKINFTITIHGKGGHGSTPQLNVDPIVCAAAIVSSLQTVVSRNTDPMDNVICSVNSIHGGSVQNLVVDRVDMTATIRSLSTPALENAEKHMEMIVQHTSEAYGCTSEIHYEERIPLTDNPASLLPLAEEAAASVVGRENLADAPAALASEDYAILMQHVPAFLYWVGSHVEGEPVYALHNARFHADDRTVPIAANLLASSARLALDKIRRKGTDSLKG